MFKYCKNCNQCFLKEPKDSDKFLCGECSPRKTFKKYVLTSCITCKAEYKLRAVRWKEGKGKFCSKSCYSQSLVKEIKKSKKEITKDYNRSHKIEKANHKHKRRAAEFKAGGAFTKKDWEEILKQHNNSCAHCKRGSNIPLTVDHIIPLKHWEVFKDKVSFKWNDKENLQPLCSTCNSRKGAKLVFEDIVRTMQKCID